MGGLSQSLLQNRMLEERRRQHADSLGLRRQENEADREERGLDRRMREEELGENRKLRTDELVERRAHQARIEALQKEGNADKRMAMGIDLLKEMNSTGQLTDEGINVMGQKFSAMFAPAGLEVKLFRRAQKKPDFNTREGHNLNLAENYRERSRAAVRNGAGDESERFLSIAERLERGGGTEDNAAELTEERVDSETDAVTRLRQKLKPGEIDAARQRIAGGTNAPAAPTPAPAKPTAAKLAVGELLHGYRFNGKFPANDKRAWDKVQ